MTKNTKPSLKIRLQKRLTEKAGMARKAVYNTNNAACAFWQGYDIAMREVLEMIK
jgi:hypothetical protein